MDDCKLAGLSEFTERYGQLIASDPSLAFGAIIKRVTHFPSTSKLIVDTTPGRHGPTHPPVE